VIARSATIGRSFAGRVLTAMQRDRPLRERLVNIGHMLSGNAFSAILALVSLSMTMRVLGPAQYGILALVVSYGRVIDRVVRFESWQPLIKYAAGLGPNPSPSALRQLYGFGLRLDTAACFVSFLSAIILALVAGPFFHVDRASFELILIFSIALLINQTGMPTAVLRMAGKFKTIAYAQAIGNGVRIILCFIGLAYHLSLAYFCAVWAICQVMSTVVMLVCAFNELRRAHVGNILTVSCRGVTKNFPGIFQFAWSSNLSMTIRSSANDLDVLIVGWLSDPVSAGLYFFAKRFAKAVQQVNVQVQAVLYPDVARLWVEQAYRKFIRATSQIQLLLGSGFFLVLIGTLAFGKLMIRLGPGTSYYGALPMLLIQIIAVGITTHAAPSRTALLAMGLQQAVLKVVLVGTIIFQLLLFLLVPIYGGMGANIAHVVLALICAVSFDFLVRRGVARARAEKRSAAATEEALAPL
jgi:O-antigen/teichoic acid export membrane protein